MIEIREGKGRWLCKFDYDPYKVAAIKQVGGARWVPDQKVWSIPPTLDSWEAMHEVFNDDELQWANPIRRWVRDRRKRAWALRTMSNANTAQLTMLPELHPELHKWISSRPYQLADVAFMAEAAHPLNTNQPGTGKTVETIASVFESGYDESPVLVVAPKTSLAPVWLQEVSHWVSGMGTPVATVTGQGDPVAAVSREALAGGPAWLVANPEAIKLKREGTPPPKWKWVYEVDWGVVVIDEFHRMGLTNNQTLAYQSLKKLRADKRICLSGTPMGGQPIKLWSVLNFLYPDEFPSKWAFAGNWLNIFDNGFGKVIGDVKKHKRQQFTEMMSEYSIRRRKIDIMKWLPPKQYVELYVDLTESQRKQYDEWEANGEIEIEEEQLDALSILALYTRLRQFAGARQTVVTSPGEEVRLTPTTDSAKLPVLWELIEERGIVDDPVPEDVEPVIVFSQFTQMIDMVEDWLNQKGVATAKITGAVKADDRTAAIEAFQRGDVNVFLMNTNAGGVAITLDRADTVIFLDETWNPDDQEQAEDRAHRGSKTSQVTIYKIISKNTIEEQVHKGNISKDTINRRVLDARHKS